MTRKKKKPPINETLKAARVKAGLTQADVAAELGVSQGRISSIESGEGAKTATRVVRFAKLLGLEIKDLV